MVTTPVFDRPSPQRFGFKVANDSSSDSKESWSRFFGTKLAVLICSPKQGSFGLSEFEAEFSNASAEVFPAKDTYGLAAPNGISLVRNPYYSANWH
jgi:hypothetical protein